VARKKYRLPISRTAAVAAAPARLAEEYEGCALWRARPDGKLEVATVRDGYLYRHLVNEDGTTTVTDSAPPPPGYRWSIPTVWAGGAVCLAALIGVAIAAWSGKLASLGPGPVFLLFIAGMAVMGIGWIPTICAEAIEQRVKHLSSATSAWHEATKLNGWAPQTSAQLVAVERLADEHDGVAQVRDLGGPTVDVLVQRWGRRQRYWVDQSGRTECAESTPQSNKDLAAEAVEVRTKQEPDRD
jgi:hypothetical protein